MTFFILVAFSGCVLNTTPDISKETDKLQRSNKKLFPQEDTLILFALRAEEVGDFQSAANIFDELYVNSKRKEYIYRSLQNELYLKNNEKVIEKVNALSETIKNDAILIRLKIVSLIQLNKFNDAQALALELVKQTEEIKDYMLISDIYTAQKEFDTAVKYLESAYLKDYNEQILDKMSIILYVNLERKKDAIAHLETHTRVHGCSIVICKRLIAFYSNDNNIDGLLSTLLRYYKIDTKPEVAKQIMQLYGYNKEYGKLILFLEGSGSDDDTLLELYISTKNYKKAFSLARELYKKTDEVKYLAESVIYEYESQQDKNSKTFLKNISQKFEELLAQDANPLYLNYYGYILIDHNVDIKKGMSYVQKALEAQPESSYYLDSLAWGHYKLGECEKSLKIINKVMTLEGGDDPEVIKHHQTIQQCKDKNKE